MTTAPFSVLIGLTTCASALAVIVVLLGLALPEFRSAVEGPFEALLPGVVDFGRESGCPPRSLALTLTSETLTRSGRPQALLTLIPLTLTLAKLEF